MKPLKDVNLDKVGMAGKFTCEISKTDLKAEWFKGKTSLRRNTKYEMTSEVGKYSLTINDADDKDEDEYTVKFKETTSTANLTVKGKLSIIMALLVGALI